MMAATDRNKPLNAEATPHLSYSRLQKYLTCPEQYRLYYIEKLRAMVENASLVFGSVMHLALAEYFRRQIDPARTFLQDWDALKDVQLRFSQKESWQKLRDIGQGDTRCRLTWSGGRKLAIFFVLEKTGNRERGNGLVKALERELTYRLH